MPRIRSIHPGFWTDEDVVAISRDARLFFIGLWGQCDDKGAFEWKPRSLKMRLFPADDDVAIDTLLRALVRADLIRSYTVEGRKFGVVRNFQKFQRPKKPNSLFPLPQEFCDYASGTGSEPVGNSSYRGRRKEGGDSEGGIPPSSTTPFTPPKSSPKGGRTSSNIHPLIRVNGGGRSEP